MCFKVEESPTGGTSILGARGKAIEFAPGHVPTFADIAGAMTVATELAKRPVVPTEILIRAREAYIAASRWPFRPSANRIRSGQYDRRLGAIVKALTDAHLPLREVSDEFAAAELLARAGIPSNHRAAAASAVMAGIRQGRAASTVGGAA